MNNNSISNIFNDTREGAYHYFIPPLTKQNKNGIGQTPTHPLNHYKFYYSPHIIHGLLKEIHNTDIMVI